jgi:hypothetical protein
MGRVIFANQWFRLNSDCPGNTADMATGIEVTTARGEITAFDAPDNRLPNAGSLTDLRNGETGLAASLRQSVTDAHAAPPLRCGTAYRPGTRAQ